MIRAYGPLTAQQRGAIERTLRGVTDECLLVDNLLDLSHLDGDGIRLNPVVCVLQDVLGGVVDCFRPHADLRRITLSTEFPELPVRIRLDAVKFRQAVNNLVNNAIGHSKSGGAVLLRIIQSVEKVVCEVIDTGEGIPEAHLPRVFEERYTVSGPGRARPGLGLGLYITSQIVHAHCGTIECESVEDLGSTFRILLPLSAVE